MTQCGQACHPRTSHTGCTKSVSLNLNASAQLGHRVTSRKTCSFLNNPVKSSRLHVLTGSDTTMNFQAVFSVTGGTKYKNKKEMYYQHLLKSQNHIHLQKDASEQKFINLLNPVR